MHFRGTICRAVWRFVCSCLLLLRLSGLLTGCRDRIFEAVRSSRDGEERNSNQLQGEMFRWTSLVIELRDGRWESPGGIGVALKAWSGSGRFTCQKFMVLATVVSVLPPSTSADLRAAGVASSLSGAFSREALRSKSTSRVNSALLARSSPFISCAGGHANQQT